MKIIDVKAWALSVPVEDGITFGIGKVLRRDTVVVRVETESGIVGYGESHHGRAASSVADIVNNLLRYFVVGMDASDVTGVWARIYEMQLRSHGMGAGPSAAGGGTAGAWGDARGRAVGWPLYRLRGGGRRGVRAWGGGVSRGGSERDALWEGGGAARALG